MARAAANARIKSQPFRRRSAPEAGRLPHPSWRLSVSGWPDPDTAKVNSATEFWDRLGL